MPPKANEKGRRKRICTRVVMPPPGTQFVPMPTSSSMAGQSSTHTAPSIQITQVSTQSLPYPPLPGLPPSFISPHLPFGPQPSYPPPIYPPPIYPPPGMQVPQQFNFLPVQGTEVPQQTQNPEVDLNDDRDEDVHDVEEDGIPNVEDENVQERQQRHAAERQLYATDHMDRFIIEPSGNSFLPNIPPANVIKEIIQEKYKKFWTSYGKLDENDKLDWFQRFTEKCTWDVRDHDIIERNFHIKAAARMSDILREVREKFKKKGIVPQWIYPNLFKQLLAYWESSEFVDVSKKAKKNRASEKGGCIYAGGSISVAEHGRRLANKLGRKPFIDELHFETHTNIEGGFVDERSRNVQEEYKKQLAIATQDGSRQVDEPLSLKIWSGVIGGKKKGRFYGAGNLAATYKKGGRTLNMKIADGEGTSQPPTLTPEMQEMIRKMGQTEALMQQMLLKQQKFEEQLQQERARSEKLQQELSQRQSNSRKTPVVEDPEDDSPYPIYGEEEEEEEEEEDEVEEA